MAQVAKVDYATLNADLYDKYRYGIIDEDKFIIEFADLNNTLLKTIASHLDTYAYRSAEASDAYGIVMIELLMVARQYKEEDRDFDRTNFFKAIEWKAVEALHEQYDETGYTRRHINRLKKSQESGVIDPRIFSETIDDLNESPQSDFDIDSQLKRQDIKMLVANLIARAVTNGLIDDSDIYIVTEIAINGTKQKKIAEHMGRDVHTIKRRYNHAIEVLRNYVNEIDPSAYALLF